MRVKGIVRGLQHVATFLNMIGPRTKHTQWPGLFRKFCAQMGLTGLRMTFAEATLLRGKIHHDLAFLRWSHIEKARERSEAPDEAKDPRPWTEDEREFFRSDASLDRPFEALLDRLNNLELKTVWSYEPLAPKGRPRDPSQAIIKVRWDDGTTGRWAAQSWPVTTTFKDALYATLGKALESGALSRLRVCRECGKYLVVADLKTRYCRTKCHDDYHNRVTRPENRKHRRERASLQAKRLLEAGESSDVIREKTGLPQRVVSRILAGQLDSSWVVEAGRASPKRVPSLAVVAQIQSAYAKDQRQAAAYAKKTTLVECPQCHRRRMVPIGARVRCDHTDRAGSIPPPTKKH